MERRHSGCIAETFGRTSPRRLGFSASPPELSFPPPPEKLLPAMPKLISDLSAELMQMLRCARDAWRLVPFKHKQALLAAALVMALTSASSTAIPVLLGRLVDGVQQGTVAGESEAGLYRLAFWFLGLIGGAYLLREGLNVLRRYLVTDTCTRINRDMSLRLVGHLMEVPLACIGHEKVGTLHGRVVRSVDGLVRFLRINFLDFLPAVFTGSFALITTVAKEPILGLVMIAVVPTSVVLTVKQLLSQKGVRLKLMRNVEEIDGAIVEQLTGIEYLRASNMHLHEMERLADATAKRRTLEVRHHMHMSLYGCAKALNEGFFHVLVLALAIHLAILGRISFGDVLTFSILFLNVMAPLAEIHRVLDEGHESTLQMNDLLEMLSEPVDPSFEPGTISVAPFVSGQPVIVADRLQVEYVANRLGSCEREIRPLALDDVSLAIHHGETIGIAGRSGSGKSTFLKVLLRLMAPSGGDIRLGDIPLRRVSRADIGRIFGYVGQSPFMFSGTISDNIVYGTGRATQEDIERVSALVHLHEEVVAMSRGYQTIVTERGQNLSGGQRQRIALARILLKQPPILILDEATSALDNITEREVQRALGMTSADRTTILVAHRLSTLRDANRILVFDEGQIAEVGDYDTLLAADGIFTRLVQSAENGVGTSIVSSPKRELSPV